MQRARAFGLCEWTPRIFLAVALTMIVTGSFAPANVRAAPNGTSARGFLGVRTEPATGGLRIVEVISSSPAERAGLAVDDLIVRINRFPAHTYDELVQVVSVTGPGGSITLRVRRGRDERDIQATLGVPPHTLPSAPQMTLGTPAPAIAAHQVSGPDGVAPAQLRGRVVVLEFWATWCGPCRSIAPRLDALHRRHRGRGLTVIGITDEPEPLVRAFLQRHPVGYNIARDAGGTTTRYGVRGVPMVVVIDRAGHVRDSIVGVNPIVLDRMEALVGQLLAEPGPPARP